MEDHALAGRLHRHVREGNDGRAARCLNSSPVAPINDSTIEQLKALHPTTPPPLPPDTGEAVHATTAYIDAAAFLGILHRLPTGKAAGLSGWTYEHIRAVGLFNERARETLRGFVNDNLSGAVPHSHMLHASRLIALEKPNGGIRPIDIGECILRFVSICALSTAGNIGDVLASLQIGVGISGGAEIPGHALRLDILDPEVVTVQVDLQNAFNLSDRTAIAHAVAGKLPGQLPYVMRSYQKRSPLVVRREDGTHEVLCRETGVRQGNLMGPLLFALAYQPTLHEAKERAAEVAVTACHDDAYLPLFGGMRLPGCPFGGALCLVCAVCWLGRLG